MDKITVRIPKSKERISVNAKPIVLSIEGGYEKGYKDGYDNGKIDGEQVGYDKGYDFGYNTGHEVGYTKGETAGYNKGYADGQSSGTDAPNPLEYAKVLDAAFKEITFPTDYELTLNIPRVTSLLGTFQQASGIKKVTLKGNESGNAVSFSSTFRNCKDVEILDLSEFNAKLSSVHMMFYYANSIREILGEIDFTECTNTSYAFQVCSNLVTFTPKANSIKLSISFAKSSLLSAASIQSIIDGLAIVETAQTITFHSSIVLTDEQKATISSKGWTLAQ